MEAWQGSGHGASATEELAQAPLEVLWRALESAPQGLSPSEAGRRLEHYGFNELPEERTNPLLRLLGYFWGPIPWMIEIAVVLSALVRHWPDFFVIVALLIINASVGFFEEYQAAGAIAALKAQLALRARVRRGGAWSMVPSRELVPGDVVRLRIGDIVPADARLFEGDPVELDQSALTGESLPVSRAVGGVAFSGSILKRGEADALVYATGSASYFGRTASLVKQPRAVSHFQRAVLKIGDFLILLALVLVVFILAVALHRGNPIARTLEFALVLTVAAIPVAMPTVLSVTMALGARVLARAQAIVSRLVSIEELAGMDLLCSDKTGTLTQNRLTLGTPALLGAASAEEVSACAALASRAEDQDPIDLAVLGGAGASGPPRGFRIVHFQPFDPVAKRTEATVIGQGGETFKVSKGAPQVILALLGPSPEVEATVQRAVEQFAARGFRSLGVARTDGEGRWRYLGILPLFDPPREDSKRMIETARQMGVAVKMLTGDQIAIGREIARQVGLGSTILDSTLIDQLKEDPDTDSERSIEAADGFAQVFPEHKYRIVEALQRHGHIVGMTGDGVNDAPALKRADAGIAVSGATDAARAAADIVLLSPGLSVIIDAIKESRRIFQRMNSYAIYRIAETIRVLVFMTLSILVFDFYPVTAIMIVLLAILNDGAILSIAYDHVRYSKRPEVWNMRRVLGVASVLGLTGVVSSFLLFYVMERVFRADRDLIQTIMYLKLSVAGHFTVFLARTRGPFWSIRPSRQLVLATVSTQIIATLIAVLGILMPAISWRVAALIWLYAGAWFVIGDGVKRAAYRMFDPQPLAPPSRAT